MSRLLRPHLLCLWLTGTGGAEWDIGSSDSPAAISAAIFLRGGQYPDVNLPLRQYSWSFPIMIHACEFHHGDSNCRAGVYHHLS